MLLVLPQATAGTAAAGYFANNDVSVRAYLDTSVNPNVWKVIPNSLSDLTKPENRFAHQNALATPKFYHPHCVAGWADPGTPVNALARLNLPLLQECSDAAWVAGGPLPTISLNTIVNNTANTNAPNPFDAWRNPHPWEPASGAIPVVDKNTGVLTNASGNPLGTRFG